MIVELNDINKASSGQPIISRFTPYEFKNTIDKIQTLDILGQLESGIRYLDIRLGYNPKKKKKGTLFFFT